MIRKDVIATGRHIYSTYVCNMKGHASNRTLEFENRTRWRYTCGLAEIRTVENTSKELANETFEPNMPGSTKVEISTSRAWNPRISRVDNSNSFLSLVLDFGPESIAFGPLHFTPVQCIVVWLRSIMSAAAYQWTVVCVRVEIVRNLAVVLDCTIEKVFTSSSSSSSSSISSSSCMHIYSEN